MSTSLEKLASYLPKDKFREMKREFESQEDIDLLTRKGVYPYEYMDSIERN